MQNLKNYSCSFLIREHEFKGIPGLTYFHYKKFFPKMDLFFIEDINDSIIKKINKKDFVWIRRPYNLNFLKKLSIPILIQDERFRSNKFSENQFNKIKSLPTRDKIFFLTDRSYKLDENCIDDRYFLYTELKKDKTKKDIDVLFIGTKKDYYDQKIINDIAFKFHNYFGDLRKKFHSISKYKFFKYFDFELFAKVVNTVKYKRRIIILDNLKKLSSDYNIYSIGYNPNCKTINYISYANKDEIVNYARRSKILIVNTSLHNYTLNERFSLALPLECIAVVEKYPQYKYKDFLQKYGFTYRKFDLEKKIKKILLNYRFFKKDFQKYNKAFTKNYNSKKIIQNLFKTFSRRAKIN